MNRHPWRAVVAARELESRHNAYNRGQRTAHWWDMDLDCGHYAERIHRPGRPAPRKVRCTYCPREGR